MVPCTTSFPLSGKKSAEKLSDVEEENEENENQVPDLDEEGEKENELCEDDEAAASNPKRQPKRKIRQDVSNEEPNNKKNKTSPVSGENGKTVLQCCLYLSVCVARFLQLFFCFAVVLRGVLHA